MKLLDVRWPKQKPGSWMDDDGACKVCLGEIPYGHTPDCDYYKLEQKLKVWEAIARTTHRARNLALFALLCSLAAFALSMARMLGWLP